MKYDEGSGKPARIGSRGWFGDGREPDKGGRREATTMDVWEAQMKLWRRERKTFKTMGDL